MSSLGGRHTAIKIFERVITAPRLKPDRTNPQIQIFQHLPHLSQGGLGEIWRKDLISGINFHGTSPQTGCRKQGFLERLAQTGQLDSDIHLLHGKYLSKWFEDREWRRKTR